MFTRKELSVSKGYRVYIDTEYIFPRMSPSSGRPTEKDLREVVQIAAIIVDPQNGRELASFNTIINPKLLSAAEFSNIRSFLCELTSLTEEALRRGAPFETALKDFRRFSGENEIWTMDADWSVLEQNCNLHHINFPFLEQKFIRVKPMLSDWGIDSKNYSSGTLCLAAHIEPGNLHEHLGLEKSALVGGVHNALHDVRSMAAAVHSFENSLDLKPHQK